MTDSTSTTTEEHLWLAFREGSESTFDLIYGKMFPVLFNYGYSLCKDEEQVKDCIQNIFVEIWQKREQVRQVFSLKHYFLKIMRRKMFKELRNKRNDYTKFFPLDFTDDDEDCLLNLLPQQQEFDSEVSSALVRRIQEGIRKLSCRKKEAILLKFYENLTYAEISEVMELRDPKYARQLIYRSLDELRKNFITSPEISLSGSTIYGMLIMLFCLACN